MADRWTLTLRNGPHVQRFHFKSMALAVDALQQRLDELAPPIRRETIGVFKRRFDPVKQVAVRAELAGPGGLWAATRGGIDLRGDGSAEAYMGRLRRSLIKPRAGESACDALRRALSDT